jgi:hypothetical protein
MNVKVINNNQIQININREDLTRPSNDKKLLKEFLNLYFRDLEEHKDMRLRFGTIVLKRIKDLVRKDLHIWYEGELDKVVN